MKLVALVFAALALAGCGTAGAVNSDTAKAFFQDIQTCDRHYSGSISPTGIGSGASVQIDCKAQPPASPPL